MELFDSSSINFSCCALKTVSFLRRKITSQDRSFFLFCSLALSASYCTHCLENAMSLGTLCSLFFSFFFGVCACVFVSDKLFAGDFANVLVTFSFRFFFSLARKKIIVFFRYAFFFFFFFFLTFAL